MNEQEDQKASMSDINPTSRESENGFCMNPQEDDQIGFAAERLESGNQNHGQEQYKRLVKEDETEGQFSVFGQQ